MKVWTDKEGNKLTAREFMSRWKEGIQKVTPLQQTVSSFYFTWLTIIGLVCGLIVSIWKFQLLWWLGIILVAGIGNTFVGLIGTYQKYLQLKKIDDIVKGEIKDGNN